MKKTLLFISFIGFATVSWGQVLGRFYYDRYWKLTREDMAFYFRTASIDTVHYFFVGEVQDFTRAGLLCMKGTYVDGIKHGEFTFYYPSGQIESTGNFHENVRTRVWKYFYRNGTPKQEVEFFIQGSYRILYYSDSTGKQLMAGGTGVWREEFEEADIPQLIVNEGSFKNYRKDGEWIFRLQDGLVMVREEYKDGQLKKGTAYNAEGKVTGNFFQPAQTTLLPHYKFKVTEEFSASPGIIAKDYPLLKQKLPQNEDEIFNVVEVSAQPECGLGGFFQTIDKVKKYPSDARKSGVEGKVFVEFVVNKDGSISDAKVVKGVSPSCDAEAIRALMEAATVCKWKPGNQRGKPVKQRYTLPVQFRR